MILAILVEINQLSNSRTQNVSIRITYFPSYQPSGIGSLSNHSEKRRLIYPIRSLPARGGVKGRVPIPTPGGTSVPRVWGGYSVNSPEFFKRHSYKDESLPIWGNPSFVTPLFRVIDTAGKILPPSDACLISTGQGVNSILIPTRVGFRSLPLPDDGDQSHVSLFKIIGVSINEGRGLIGLRSFGSDRFQD